MFLDFQCLNITDLTNGRMNPSLVSHGFATLPPLPGCALTPLLRPRPRQTAAWWRAVNSQPKITRIKSRLSSLRVKNKIESIWYLILPFKHRIQHHWSRLFILKHPTEAPAAVFALAVLQTWRRHNRNQGPRCGSVAVNGADFLNALDQEDGMSNQHIAALLDTKIISSTYSEKVAPWMLVCCLGFKTVQDDSWPVMIIWNVVCSISEIWCKGKMAS